MTSEIIIGRFLMRRFFKKERKPLIFLSGIGLKVLFEIFLLSKLNSAEFFDSQRTSKECKLHMNQSFLNFFEPPPK